VKNSSAVGWAALGMFAWGVAKAYAVLGPGHSGCPICTAADVSDPKKLAHSVLLGPLLEEVNFREALPRLMGEQGSAMAFGAVHADPGLGAFGNAIRVLEAGLAGGFVYMPAFKNGGLLGATLVHSAHNLGAALGTYSVMQRRVEAEGWERVPVAVVPTHHHTDDGTPAGVAVMACRRRRPLRITG